ncbi:MAG: CHAP domain-containing protein, partial [Proteobacteria bacterium]|nr:CHAP domain-containing protein [Pseudomonadota bacterium]
MKGIVPPVTLSLCAVAIASPAPARSLLDYVGQCVPFARQASGIAIYGDAWTWWPSAKGQYGRGSKP